MHAMRTESLMATNTSAFSTYNGLHIWAQNSYADSQNKLYVKQSDSKDNTLSGFFRVQCQSPLAGNLKHMKALSEA